MRLEEGFKSYINDVAWVNLLNWMTYSASGDVAAAWVGRYAPATKSDDDRLMTIARFSLGHYMLYQYFIANFMGKRGRVMDVGCGSGHRSSMLTRYASYVMALDSSDGNLGFAAHFNYNNVVRYFKANFPTDVDRTERFDYIFAIEVIEHVALEKQDEFISVALDMLEPGGRLFISAPHDKEVDRKPPHIGLWDNDEFLALAERFGANMAWADYVDVEGLGYLLDVTVNDLLVGHGDHYVMVLGK